MSQQMRQTSAETNAWSEAFAAPELAERRRRTYRVKLDKLGLLEAVEGFTLDIACGHGDALQVLAHAGQQHLLGMDLISPERSTPRPFRQLLANGTSLPLADGSVERIMCLHSLHHFRSFDDIRLLLEECRRVLAPGGGLYLIDHWGSPWLRGLFHVLEWRCPLYPRAARHFGEQLREEHDAIFWWLSEWKRLYGELERAGFKVSRRSRSASFLHLTCRPDEPRHE